jgi:hypothetical protein
MEERYAHQETQLKAIPVEFWILKMYHFKSAA